MIVRALWRKGEERDVRVWVRERLRVLRGTRVALGLLLRKLISILRDLTRLGISRRIVLTITSQVC